MRYREAGRLLGKADTEVGARWLEDHWSEADSVPSALTTLHDTFGGHANLAVLTSDGRRAITTPATTRTRSSRSASARFGLACTGMYSLDRSVFKYVVPEATDRKLVPFEHTATI